MPKRENGVAIHTRSVVAKREDMSPSECEPSALICPITHDLMRDPVLAADGHAYERVAIEDWFSRQLTSPITGERLDSAMLMPCVPLKNMAKAFRAGGT